jgi:EAL domain-containing protein (putative c-di-GMP-specific phosphodiesterase class I)
MLPLGGSPLRVEQRDAVAAEGCTEMQGFLFSEPVSSDAIGPLLSREHQSHFGSSAA